MQEAASALSQGLLHGCGRPQKASNIQLWLCLRFRARSNRAASNFTPKHGSQPAALAAAQGPCRALQSGAVSVHLNDVCAALDNPVVSANSSV